MRTQHRTKSAVASVALIAVALGCIPALANAQSTHLAVKAGMDFDREDALVSSHLLIPVSRQVDFNPSIDVYMPERGSLTGFNADLKYRVPSLTPTGLYLGGGLNLLVRSIDGQSDNDLGAKFFMGVESRAGWVHPFVEGRALMHDNTAVQLLAGLNFTLAR